MGFVQTLTKRHRVDAAVYSDGKNEVLTSIAESPLYLYEKGYGRGYGVWLWCTIQG